MKKGGQAPSIHQLLKGQKRSGFLETAVEVTGDLDVHHLAASHIGIRRLDGTEDSSEFAGLRIHFGDRETHGAHTIDVALVVVLLELLVITTKSNQALGVLNTCC